MESKRIHYTKFEKDLHCRVINNFIKTDFIGKIWAKERLIKVLNEKYQLPLNVIKHYLKVLRKAKIIKYYFRYEPVTRKYKGFFEGNNEVING